MTSTSLENGEILRLAQETISQDIVALEAIRRVIGKEFCDCVKKIVCCEGIIWVTGVGTSAYVGQRLAHILTCTGLRSIFLSPVEGLHGHTMVLRPDDLLVAISRGGESDEVISTANIAKCAGVPVLALVKETESSLGKIADLVLPIYSPDEYELGGYLATTSSVAFSVVCDALCTVVLRYKGGSLSRLIYTHPGGAVGKSLQENPRVS